MQSGKGLPSARAGGRVIDCIVIAVIIARRQLEFVFTRKIKRKFMTHHFFCCPLGKSYLVDDFWLLQPRADIVPCTPYNDYDSSSGKNGWANDSFLSQLSCSQEDIIIFSTVYDWHSGNNDGHLDLPFS